MADSLEIQAQKDEAHSCNIRDWTLLIVAVIIVGGFVVLSILSFFHPVADPVQAVNNNGTLNQAGQLAMAVVSALFVRAAQQQGNNGSAVTVKNSGPTNLNPPPPIAPDLAISPEK